MSNILFITPMWHEEATPHDAKVCNYFVDDWIKQGHKVVIVHYRSSFPSLYMKIAKMFPAVSKMICGDNTYVNETVDEYIYDYKGHVVYSIPIFKYIPHGSFADATLDKQAKSLNGKHPIKDDYPGCWGVATFASNTKSHDDKGRGRPGDCLLRREQDQLQTAPV